MRVVIVEDHDLLRRGLAVLIQSYDDILLAGEAQDGEEAVRVAVRSRPDVILMDLKLPNMDGVRAIRQIKAANPGVRVIVLTVEIDPKRLQQALDAGAERILEKTISTGELLHALRHPLAEVRAKPTQPQSS